MLDDFATQLTAWRHHLHQHPELSRHEKQTAAFVCARLDDFGIPYEAGIGGHGVVASLKRSGSNRSVGLRADMDALPIPEATGKSYASRNHGVMHACGHDGHTTSLLGAAKLLQDDPDWSGLVHFVFQPAEEGFNGADAMVADGLFERFPMGQIFGYHNWPGLEAGTVMLHPGVVMAGATNFEITLKGKAGHAGMPHLCTDPVQGIAQLVVAVNSIVARNLPPLAAGVISTCRLKAGEAHNQVPESASMGGTIRAFSAEAMVLLKRRLSETAHGVATTFGLEADIWMGGELAPTRNSLKEVDLAAEAARAAGLKVRQDMEPTMGAEDFGRFLADIPGAYVWIGNGPSAGLHNPEYDYNDTILLMAARFLAACAKAALR
ncbi:amidohydrolase [Acidocella sp.]|uniref:amidohydrolase n=1 Tax=Acidocella sp. TaxID=50710 RepID=UPI00261D8CCA|nr:amidohydrolase [Acidocella sp.]